MLDASSDRRAERQTHDNFETESDVCIQLCDKVRRTDDVESNMIDKVINKSSRLMYALGRREVIRFLESIAGLRRRKAT